MDVMLGALLEKLFRRVPVRVSVVKVLCWESTEKLVFDRALPAGTAGTSIPIFVLGRVEGDDFHGFRRLEIIPETVLLDWERSLAREARPLGGIVSETGSEKMLLASSSGR